MRVTAVSPSPGTVEVVRHAFISGAEQMRRNLYRSAFSPVIYEMKDCSVGIYDAKGALLGQAPGLPFFLGSLGGTIREVILRKGVEIFEADDIWIVNDSTICGSHLNDITVFSPVFIDSTLRGFAGAKAHCNDVGAKEAGYVGDSVDIFQEGFRIGPTRIVHQGKLDEQILGLIARNSRFPTSIVGDLMAEFTACRTGVECFHSIVERFGWLQVASSIHEIFVQAESMDRESVRAIPDGEYSAEGSLDNDGVTDDPVDVKVTVRIDGDEMEVDLSGSSAQCTGSVNCGLVQTRSAIEQAFKFLVNPTATVSGGNFRNLRTVVPEGSCFNPAETAPCLHYGPHLMLAMDLIIRALSDAVPERAAAGHVGDSWNVTLVGEDDNGLFLSGESLVGGWGAYEGGDGESALIHSAAGDFKNFPVETMEQRYPLRILQHGLRKDSGGVGRWTGGMGIVREYEVLSPCRLQLWFERVGTPSWGLSGGGDGAPPDVSVILPGQKPRQIFKVNAMPIPAGTRVLVKTGGGGGWGIPQEKGAG